MRGSRPALSCPRCLRPIGSSHTLFLILLLWIRVILSLNFA
jgi:hypothetical protein